MSALEIALVVLRWTHILAASALFGGAVFMRQALLDSAAELPDDAHDRLRQALRARWAPVVMASAGLLVLSGFASFGIYVASYSFDKAEPLGKFYHMLFGVKFLLALPVLYIATTLVGRSESAQKMRANARYWLTLNLILAIAVICVGGLLRFAPRELKGGSPSPTIQATM